VPFHLELKIKSQFLVKLWSTYAPKVNSTIVSHLARLESFHGFLWSLAIFLDIHISIELKNPHVDVKHTKTYSKTPKTRVTLGQLYS